MYNRICCLLICPRGLPGARVLKEVRAAEGQALIAFSLLLPILLLLLMSLLLLVLCHSSFDVGAIWCWMVRGAAAILFAPGVLGVSLVVWVLLIALIWLLPGA